MRKLGISTALLLLPLLAHAGPAYGASANASPTDPPAGSPPGAVYQLPFEEGRADASPKGSGGTSVPGGTGGGGGNPGATGQTSVYRSENNFGSSSEVPGVPSGGGANGAGQSAGGGGGGSNGAGSGPGGSGTSGGSGGSSGSSSVNSGLLADSGNTSPAANIGLLLLIAVIGVGIGVFSIRAGRLRHQR